MTSAHHLKLHAEYSRGKRRRGVVCPCAGCLSFDFKPGAFGSFASKDRPLTIEYTLCDKCSRKLDNPRKRKRLAAAVEENLEALGAFELGISRGSA